MPGIQYFRRQADLCLRLSLISSDEEVSTRLILMAEEYKAKAAALEVDAEPQSGEAIPDRSLDDKLELD